MKAAFIMFDNMTALDFIGFYDPLSRLRTMKVIPEFEWRICACSSEIRDDRGLGFKVDCVGDSLAGYDLVFIPGGFGTRELQRDQAFVAWLASAADVPMKISVCTGALLLGAAGFLRGLKATTHPSAYDELVPYCATVLPERIVDQGAVITGRGVSSSIDLGLHVVERLAGKGARERIAKQMDYPYVGASVAT
jgi:cyclohexyl-isocyanide hydratase